MILFNDVTITVCLRAQGGPQQIIKPANFYHLLDRSLEYGYHLLYQKALRHTTEYCDVVLQISFCIITPF
jgi:hypothetical protein